MGEDEKKDYRLHLINTIDNAIDNGISVYDLDVVNKKAIRHNYINKQAVIDELNRHKLAYKEFNKMYNNTHYEDDEIRARDFYMIVTEDRIVQVLTKLLGGERNESI